MSKETVFADGLICKRKENAPDFVVCNLSIKKSEFVPFINGDKIYAKLDTWEPDPAKVHADGVQQVRSTLATSAATEQFSDDIPF
jgi:hypothetical protein